MQNTKYSILDTDRIGSLLFKLALPAFVGMSVVALYNVVNTIFIGHYVGSLGIAGLSIAFPYQMLAVGIGQLSGIGGASLISRLIGARDHARAEKVLGNAILFNIIISIIITVIGVVYIEFWVKLAGADEATIPYARDYLMIIFYGYIIGTFVMAFNALTISQGNTRVPMIGQVAGALLNIILDAILVIGLKMGVTGAAIGTIVAQFLTVIIFLIYYFSHNSYLKIHWKNMVPDFSIIKDIVAIGISAFAATLAGSIVAIVVMRMLLNYGGDLAISTFGIMNRIMMFTMFPGLVIGQGLQPIIGFNFGAKRYDRVLRGIKLAFIVTIAVGFLAFFILYFFPEPIVKIFTTENDLIQSTVYAIRRAFFLIYIVGGLMLGTTIFQALGKAGQSFLCSMARAFLFMLPCLYISGHFWGVQGIWLSFPTVDFVTTILVILLLIPQIKELRRKRDVENTSMLKKLETSIETESRK